MALSLVALETFFWVSQLNGFTAAAAQLNVTQPTVSYRIRELEEHLGVALFARRGHRLALTSEGAALRRHAESVIAIMRDIETNIVRRDSTVPTLGVGVIDSFAAICLPALLAELDERFPGLRISTTVETSHGLAGKLAQGLLDVAVLSTPPEHDNVALDLLGRQSVAWMASPAIDLPAGEVSHAALLAHRIYATPAPSNLHALTTGTLAGCPDADLRLNICNDIGVIIDLITAGTGIGILPVRLLQPQLQRGTVRILPTNPPLPLQDVFIGTNKGRIVRALPRVVKMIGAIAGKFEYCR